MLLATRPGQSSDTNSLLHPRIIRNIEVVLELSLIRLGAASRQFKRLHLFGFLGARLRFFYLLLFKLVAVSGLLKH
ncbi:hypothetical protein L1987_12619 [Smallanthus sonchifolius]|uniref:Uncharacterized protein n=1 Tax=Smallanthus sonchifolius TaxID=185202 RepID=A0ACB9JGF6_9ASTR|nr:hypothetical protein L1987_12619 [Smallanthus sonchifolius]